MNGGIPDDLRPYMDGHIAAFYGRKPDTPDVEAYVVDPSLDGKMVKFSNVAHDDSTSSGIGTLKIVANGNFGHIEIHTESHFDGKRFTDHHFFLPESWAARLKKDGAESFVLEG